MASIKHQMHPVPFAEGNTFAVVDAGGGTVDITTHEVEHLATLSHVPYCCMQSFIKTVKCCHHACMSCITFTDGVTIIAHHLPKDIIYIL